MGNFSSSEAIALLAHFRQRYKNPALGFIVGLDGCRNLAVIERCHRPDRPATRQFLVNALDRASEVIAGPCLCEGSYDGTENTWNQDYIAKRDLVLHAAGESIAMAKNEGILAIRSAKWSQLEVDIIAEQAGFQIDSCWKTR